MDPWIKLVGTLLFLLGAGSMFYVWVRYERYRALWSQHKSIGTLSRIRASMKLLHDSTDTSDECTLAFVRLKRAILVSFAMMLPMIAFVLSVRLFGGLSD